MLQRFSQFISEHNMISEDTQILATVSGGKDSVTMCELFHLSGIKFAIAHCNFQLRGKDSDLDEEFVRKLAEGYKVPFFVKRFDTETYSKVNGVSIQMAARDLRYAWFRQVALEQSFSKIATAHHLNDVFETILLNLTRGTGFTGLVGIQPVNGDIIRPLLFCKREEIDLFVAETNLNWREDISNASTKYYRNLIRHKVIPILKEINPGLEKTAMETTEKIRAVNTFFKAKIKKIRDEAFSIKDSITSIDLERILSEPEPEIVLWELLSDYGFSFQDCKKILAGRKSGSIFYSQDFTLNIDRKILYIEKTVEQSESAEFRITDLDKKIILPNFILSINKIPANEFDVHSDNFTANLDFSLLTFPLVVRKWKEGDRFMPLGMKNFKKMSDFLIDRKTPLLQKNNTLVITSGEEIIWVLGMRLDERFKITEKSKTVLKITAKPH